MEPDDILSDLTEVFKDKNSDYADTWIVTGVALAALHDEPVELETVEDHIVNGNVHRLLDKILRGYNAAVINDGEMNYEAAQDSFEDASVYSAMLASVVADDQTGRLDNALDNIVSGGDEADDVEDFFGAINVRKQVDAEDVE